MSGVLDAAALVPRTEAEVAADAVWALIQAGLLGRSVHEVERALDAVGIRKDDLRAAADRWERLRGAPPPAPTPAVPVRHPRPPEPGTPPPPPPVLGQARGELGPWLPTRTCRRCGVEKPTSAFPLRRGKLGWWCLPCSTDASERVVRQRRAGEKAVAALALHRGDALVGMACEACGAELRAGQWVVIAARPRHEECP